MLVFGYMEKHTDRQTNGLRRGSRTDKFGRRNSYLDTHIVAQRPVEAQTVKE